MIFQFPLALRFEVNSKEYQMDDIKHDVDVTTTHQTRIGVTPLHAINVATTITTCTDDDDHDKNQIAVDDHVTSKDKTSHHLKFYK